MKPEKPNLAKELNSLSPKTKTPVSARILNGWISQAQEKLGTSGPRLGWLVATTVISAALQRVVDETDQSRFLLKGGTMLQYRLSAMSRTTQDIDGLIRGSLDSFMEDLDKALRLPWGPFTFERSEIHMISVPQRHEPPWRFSISVMLNGIRWRRVQIEISNDTSSASEDIEFISPPSLAGFGLPSPMTFASLSLRYQIAQKIHASTDPHEPPLSENNRSRDVVDLLLLKNLTETSGVPTNLQIRQAVEDVFATRAHEANVVGALGRAWPTKIVAYQHWQVSYDSAALSAGVDISLEEAVAEINIWLAAIEKS